MNRILPALSLAAAFAAAPAFADALDSAAATGGALAAGISEEEAALTDVWQGKIAFGAETRSGNTEQDGVNGSFEMRKLQGETIVLASVNGAWEQQETADADGANRRDERTVGNVSADLNLKQRLGGFFVYGDLAGLHDGVAGVKYRFIQSVGLGTFLADADDFKFSVEAGLAEVEEKLDGIGSDEYLALRLAERADWVPDFAEGVSFFEAADYLVDFEDGDRYFANLELGMDVPMFEGLSLTVKGVVNYNNVPAVGKERCDRQLLVQVGYNF